MEEEIKENTIEEEKVEEKINEVIDEVKDEVEGIKDEIKIEENNKNEEKKIEKSEQNQKPWLWKKGQSGNPAGKPKGTKSFKTLFEEAVKKLGMADNPTDVEIEILKKGIEMAKSGKFPFYKDMFDRIYGQPAKSIEIESDGLPVVIKVVRDESEQ